MNIDIQTVPTTFNEKLKNILKDKRDDNNSLLSTKDYSYFIEKVRKSKMCLKLKYLVILFSALRTSAAFARL